MVRTLPLALTVLVTLAAGEAAAHGLYADAGFDSDGRVRVSVSTGKRRTPTTGASVSVTDATGRPVAGGRTGAGGRWEFDRPPPGRYTIRVEYVGHDAVVELTIPDEADGEGIRTSPVLIARPAALWIGVGVAALILAGVVAAVVTLFRSRRRATG
jgi:hypothetical protein